MKVFVAGATGAIGRFLVPALRDAGHDVVGMSRSPQKAQSVRAAGAEPVICDALDREAVIDAIATARPDAVIHELTAIPDVIKPRRMAKQFRLTNRLRTEGTRNLLEGAERAGAGKFIAQSIAFAYEPTGGPIKSEDAPLYLGAPPEYRPLVQALDELERAVVEASGTVLRYGQFYGPGSAYGRDRGIAAQVRKRQFPIVGDGGGIFSFVHAGDAADATVAALSAPGGDVYNIVDDDPAPLREWLPEYAAALGAPPPRRVPVWLARLVAGRYGVEFMTQLRGASNEKAKAQLRWDPAHPSWRQGFRVGLGGEGEPSPAPE